MYSSLAELDKDLDYARKNPNDEMFFIRMVERYRNSSKEVKEILKSELFDRLLEYNPSYVISKVAEENPHSTVHRSTQQDPFFHV
jgi:hypothetical protein